MNRGCCSCPSTFTHNSLFSSRVFKRRERKSNSKWGKMGLQPIHIQPNRLTRSNTAHNPPTHLNRPSRLAQAQHAPVAHFQPNSIFYFVASCTPIVLLHPPCIHSFFYFYFAYSFMHFYFFNHILFYCILYCLVRFFLHFYFNFKHS